MRRALVLACLGGLGLACQQRAQEDARTLAKLKAESERQQLKSRDPNAGLVAVVESPTRASAFQPRALPAGLKPEALGALRVELKSATMGQTVTTPRVSLSTAEAFLRLDCTVFNGAKTATEMDLTRARLRYGEHELSIAPDVQSAAGTRDRTFILQPQESKAITLFFEIAPSALPGRLALVLSTPDGASATLSF